MYFIFYEKFKNILFHVYKMSNQNYKSVILTILVVLVLKSFGRDEDNKPESYIIINNVILNIN